MKVGMVIFRDCTDEVTIDLVSEDNFNAIRALFNVMTVNDEQVEFVQDIVDKNSIEHCHQQTFCLDMLDWSEYDIIGVHTLPEY